MKASLKASFSDDDNLFDMALPLTTYEIKIPRCKNWHLLPTKVAQKADHDTHARRRTGHPAVSLRLNRRWEANVGDEFRAIREN